MKIDPEFRAKLVSEFPDLVLPAATRSFFCSQFVSRLLEEAGLLESGLADGGITPTGLHSYMLKKSEEWADVTAEVYSEEALSMVLGSLRASLQADYTSSLASLKLARAGQSYDPCIGVISGSMDKMNTLSHDVLRRLEKFGKPRQEQPSDKKSNED